MVPAEGDGAEVAAADGEREEHLRRGRSRGRGPRGVVEPAVLVRQGEPVGRETGADRPVRRSFERVVATTVWLLDHTLIRIGNAEYSGDSYGLTTLLDDHVDIGTTTLRFRFVGKSGKLHDVVLADRRVARIVRGCQELPGQQLLQYVDGDTIRGVGSRDVNDYIRDVTRTGFTAKTFRTWGGSAYALGHLRAAEPAATELERKRQLRDAIRATADRLRNTPTVCRASYVHPAVIDAHADGSIHELAVRRRRSDALLGDDEVRLVRLLEQRL